MRAPGSSISPARPPTGIWTRVPSAFTATKAPSWTSSWARSTKTSDARSLSGIGFGGGRPGRFTAGSPGRPPDQHQPAAEGLCPAETLGEGGEEDGRIGDGDGPGQVHHPELGLAGTPA